MRIYVNFTEAMSEIERDVAEMGILVHPWTYQDKVVRDNPEFDTRELQNYIYTVSRPSEVGLKPTQPWAKTEFSERIQGIELGAGLNPGRAWKLRPDVWREFLHDGRFSYTYAERFSALGAGEVLLELKKRRESRQLFLAVWDADEDVSNLGGVERVPCTLGYWFVFRQGKLNMTYLQRSADLKTHFHNDVYLAYRLLDYFSCEAELEVGSFTHWIGSLHMFKKDAEGVF